MPRETIEDWQLAKIALESRPDSPDGWHNNRPFFFLRRDPKNPSVGYHIWWDIDLSEQVAARKSGIGFLFTIGDELAIRGGLAAMLSGRSLEEIHNDLLRKQLIELIDKVEPHLFRGGKWLDLGSGDGVTIECLLRERGVTRCVHVDQNPRHKERYLGQAILGRKTRKEDFIVSPVEIINGSSFRDREFSGITLLNVWPNLPFLDASFKIASEKLTEGGVVVVICDHRDIDVVRRRAAGRGFIGNWSDTFPSGAILRRN